jgi:hypothetical protein
MTDTHTHTSGGITEHARAFVASNFAPREHGSGALAIALFVIAGLAIATTAGRVDPAFAIYSAGLTACAAGFVMVIGWGAAGGHGGVCLCTADVIAERAQQLDARLDAIESRLDTIAAGFNETAGAMRDNMRDELTRRRGQN